MSKKLPLRFLITGGCGFIGSAFVRFLIKKTNKIVFNLDKITYASNKNSLDQVKNSKRYNFFKCDICNYVDLKKIIFQVKPDIICHLAAETHVDNSIHKPKDFIQTNIIGSFNLLISLEDINSFNSIPLRKNTEGNFTFFSLFS